MFSYTDKATVVSSLGYTSFGVWTDGVALLASLDQTFLKEGKEYRVSIMPDMDDISGAVDPYEYSPLHDNEICFTGKATRQSGEVAEHEMVIESKKGFKLISEVPTSMSDFVEYQLQENQSYRIVVSEIVDVTKTEITRDQFEDALKAVLQPNVYQAMEAALAWGDVPNRCDWVAKQMLLDNLRYPSTESNVGPIALIRAVAKHLDETGVHGLV